MAGFDSLDGKLSSLFNTLEGEHGLPSGLLKAVAYTESNYNPNARSPVGASGMFQFMPGTAKQYGVNVADPISSAKGAAKMYADLLKQNGGDLNRALAGYNWGQGNLQRKGLERAPAETRGYINKVNGLLSGGQKMANKEITPEMMEAYKAYQEQNQPAPAATQEAQISPEMLEAYKAYQAQNSAPAEMSDEERAFAPIVLPSETRAQAQPAAQQPAPGVGIYSVIREKAQKGEDLTKVWNSLDEREKKHLGAIFEGEYKRSGGQDSIAQSLYEGLAFSMGKVRDSAEQIGTYLNPVAAIRGDYSEKVDAKNQEIASRQANREMIAAMRPSAVRDVAEVGGDIAGALVGGGGTAFAKTAAGAAPGLIVKGAGNVSRAADLAAQGAIASAAMNPVVNAQNPEETNFIGGKLQQAAIGGVLGGGIGLGAEKAVGAIANKMSASQRAAGGSYTREQQEFINNAEANGLPWFRSDLPGASDDLVGKAQFNARTNKDFREKVGEQQKAVTRAVDDEAARMPNPKTSDLFDETGLSRVLQDDKNPFHSAAKELEEKISNAAPDDVNAIVKYGAEAKLLADRAKNRGQWDEVEKMVPEGTQVPLLKSINAVEEARKKLEAIAAPSQRAKFQSIYDDMKGVIEKARSGQNSYAEINQFSREMGDAARDAKMTGNDNGARILNQFKEALRRDRDEYVEKLPGNMDVKAYKKKYEEATKFNKENIQNIKAQELSQLFEAKTARGKENLADNVIDKLVKKGEIQKVKQIVDALPQSSRDALANGMIQKILKDARDKDGDIIPGKLISNFRSYENKSSGQTPIAVILKPDAKKQWDTLMSTMARMQNVGHNKLNPANGAQNTAAIQGIETMGAIASAKSTLGLSLLRPLAKLMESKSFIKSLTDKEMIKRTTVLDNTPPTSPLYSERVGKLASYISSTYVD